MAAKPCAQAWTVREQIVEDPVSGLTFQFALVPGSSAPVRLRIFGNLPYGNREFLFSADGIEAGAGSALAGACHPGWIRAVE